MKQILFFILVIFLLNASLGAKDFNIGIRYSGYYSDNIFMNASAVTDYVSQLHTDLNISVKKINLYLDATAALYSENPEFNSFDIEPGIEFLHSLKGRNSLYLGLAYTVLNYKELYIDFNYTGPQFQANVKFYTSPQTLLKAGYLFQSRNYANYESFDFSNHNLFLEFQRFFKSQTTVFLQAGFNYRFYPHIVVEFDFGENYNYYDHGKSYGKNKKQHGGGQAPQYNYNTMSVPNMYGLFRISQAMGTRLGITGEAQYRHNFQGLEDAGTLIKNSYIIYPYNDDYLWDGSQFGLKVKMVLFKNLSVEGKFSYFDKNYPGVFIMDADGNVKEPAVERKDTLLLYHLKIAKKTGKFDLFANLLYRDNTSNDDYFFYNMLTISAGIGYYF